VYQWLLFLHIAAVLSFMLAHGVQAAIMWIQHWEPDPERNLALLESLPSLLLVRLPGTAIVVTGFLLVSVLSVWGQAWVWLSLFLLIGIWLAMWRFGAGYYDRIQAAATRALEARGTPEEAAAADVFTSARLGWHPIGMTVIGLGGLAAILWLMIFKPF